MTINLPQVARVIGWLLMIEGLFLLLPLVTALIYGEDNWDLFAIAAAAAAGVGALMTFCIRPRYRDMGKREGFLLTSLVWVVFSAFGMIPFVIGDNSLSIADGYFEAMSGFTTTGASVIESPDGLPHSILMWRGEMNWIGGMGIILFTLAVLPMLNHSGGMQMFNAEVTGITHDKIRPRVSQTAKELWMVYIVLTTILVLLLWIGPMDFFDSLCHAFSTISTGGFSTRTGSIGDWSSVYTDVVITVFMFLGGVNFALLYRAAHGEWRNLWRNDVFVTFLKIIVLYYVVFVVVIVTRGECTSWKSVTIDPLFLIISGMTSTGYTVGNFERWGTFALSMVFFMMFFGACAGSTSGGAKIDRLLYLNKNLRNEIYRCVHPNSILTVRVNGLVMGREVVSKVIAFLCLYVLTIAVGGAVLTAVGLPLVDAFFSTFSCISNVGLGAGVTGYGGGYDLVPPLGKWILSLIMLIGRLEVFTVLILFSPGFWRK